MCDFKSAVVNDHSTGTNQKGRSPEGQRNFTPVPTRPTRETRGGTGGIVERWEEWIETRNPSTGRV